MRWTLERSVSTVSVARMSKAASMMPSFVVPYSAVGECSTASRRPTWSPWRSQARRRVGAAGRSVSWRTDWSSSAVLTRSRMRLSVERSIKTEPKPWLIKIWCIPPNPEFVWKLEDVLEVYKRPYDPLRPVVCMDETSKQLVGETRLPDAAPGRPRRVEYEYQRKGVTDLFRFF